MLYHYISWAFGEFPSESIMARIGVYGVSIFYVLSGLTLYHVYFNKMIPNTYQVIDFSVKRIFRIFPLLWLATFATIIIHNKDANFLGVALNLTGAFGFLKWDNYIATGAWSIGNELVFYVFFPFFVWFTKSYKWMMGLLNMGILACFLYFAFIVIPKGVSAVSEWKNYVNPLNQVFLFLSGFLIGLFFNKRKVSGGVGIMLLFIAVMVFCYYPVQGDRIQLIGGFTRIILSLTCIVTCFVFFKVEIPMPGFVKKLLTGLGESSYSLYLLHPVFFYTFKNYSIIENPLLLFLVTSILSFVGSYFIYKYYEQYFIRLGRRVMRLTPLQKLKLDNTK